jgi:hypothetical protein
VSLAQLGDGRSHDTWFPSELFPASVLRGLGAALRRQRGGDYRLVPVHVGDGRDADALTDAARRRGVVARHVGGGDDGSDAAAMLGANALALPPDLRQDRQKSEVLIGFFAKNATLRLQKVLLAKI